MNIAKKLSICTLLVVVSLKVSAKDDVVSDECNSYLGKTIVPVAIDSVIQKVSKLPQHKGEFETTQEFDARTAIAVLNSPVQFIVGSPMDHSYIQYDADGRKIIINSEAMFPFSFSYASYPDSNLQKININTLHNVVGLVVSKKSQKIGTYRASNSFGASVNVVKYRTITKYIFEREAKSIKSGYEYEHILSMQEQKNEAYNEEDDFKKYREDLLNAEGRTLELTRAYMKRKEEGKAENAKVKGRLVEINNIDPSVARKIKTSLKAAYLIEPKAPYFAQGEVSHDSATMDNPVDEDETLQVVVADFKCGFITDALGSVLAAMPTQ